MKSSFLGNYFDKARLSGWLVSDCIHRTHTHSALGRGGGGLGEGSGKGAGGGKREKRKAGDTQTRPLTWCQDSMQTAVGLGQSEPGEGQDPAGPGGTPSPWLSDRSLLPPGEGCQSLPVNIFGSSTKTNCII